MKNEDKFICSICGLIYRWFMKGGTNKMIGDPVGYSDNNATECCYCFGCYPDGTLCHGGKKK